MRPRLTYSIARPYQANGSFVPCAVIFSSMVRRLLLIGPPRPDEGEVAVAFGPVQPVADDEAIFDGEAEVVDGYLDLGARWFVEESADLDARRAPGTEQLEEVGDGEARVDDVLDDEDVFAFDGAAEVLGDLDDAARAGAFTVATDAEELDAERGADSAGEVGGEDEAALEDADEDQAAVGVVFGDLLAELLDAGRDLLGGDQGADSGLRHGGRGITA